MKPYEDMDASLMQNTRLSLALGRSTNGYHGQRGIDRAIAKGFCNVSVQHQAMAPRPALRSLGI